MKLNPVIMIFSFWSQTPILYTANDYKFMNTVSAFYDNLNYFRLLKMELISNDHFFFVKWKETSLQFVWQFVIYLFGQKAHQLKV